MEPTLVKAYTENVVILQDEKGKVIAFISHETVYGARELDSEAIAKLIDPDFGVISRSVPRGNEKGGAG